MNAHLHARFFFDDLPAETWPVNEIMLQSLIFAGRTDPEIAEKFKVDAETVAALRGDFGL